MTGATARRAGGKSRWSDETPADVLADAAGSVNGTSRTPTPIDCLWSQLGCPTLRRSDSMAKPMTKTKIVAALAEHMNLNKKTSAAYLEALASLAHKEAKNGFTIPGIGKLVVRSYKARIGRNPQTGEPIKIPARKRLKFVVAKAAKDAVGTR
jgi:DNA-binding protein HU-beta